MESAGISLRRCTLKLPLAHPFFSSPAEVMEIQWTRSSSLLSPGRINPCCSVGRRFFPQLHTSPVLTSLQAILCTHCSFSEGKKASFPYINKRLAKEEYIVQLRSSPDNWSSKNNYPRTSKTSYIITSLHESSLHII
ncbi:unnamed protein product [Cuscuta epithymum]|uniref:Uncharacterized protein n=1 Tax=Cuscuta epithymum TaxID=186058 RepID=A0AAV0DIX9_9ASTE|nr:unnamed protein product [Cuscuta epithymum]